MKAPFPYFGGKSKAAGLVWGRFGSVKNYVEPFAGSAAMLLARPDGGGTETINDADGFVSNFWRAVAKDPEGVARAADWPVNEVDLFARHSWLVWQASGLLEKLHGDIDFFDSRVAGLWVWGLCAWIGDGWCSGKGPWVHDGETIIDSRQLPHLGNAGRGVNRQLPHLGAGTRLAFLLDWVQELSVRLCEVRVACGDWKRVLGESVTVKHGETGIFLDPPYTKGAMDYAFASTGGVVAADVRDWCAANGDVPKLKIAICGHAGEHDSLLSLGWTKETWKAGGGYARGADALRNGETIWFNRACIPPVNKGGLL